MDEIKDVVKAILEPVLNFAVNNSKKEVPAAVIENEKTDKRKLIDEVAGIMKSGGCDDELIRTAIGKMEKIGYDKSETGTADNSEQEPEKDKKKVDDLEKKVTDDVENGCGKKKSITRLKHLTTLKPIILQKCASCTILLLPLKPNSIMKPARTGSKKA